MNHRIILKLLAAITLTLAFAFLLSFAVGFAAFGERGSTSVGWLMSIGIALCLAALLGFFGRKAETTFFKKEALATIGLGWLAASVVGALPYLLVINASVADALFESSSGLTTTGASVFSEIESFPASVLFWRCLSQWIGGLGVVVFFVAILSFLGAGGKILYSNEASAQAADLNTARVQDGVTKIAQLYLGISAACALVYAFCGLSWFDAICHMFSTVSTGGFSTRAASIGAFDHAALEWFAIAFMLLCGTSFPLLLRVLRGDFRELRRNAETRAYVLTITFVLLTIGTILVYTAADREFWQTLRASAFQTVSIITTTGYATEDYTLWTPAARLLIFSLMIVGGCSGSTAGGLKVGRLVAAWRICGMDIERTFRTHVMRTLRLNGRTLHDDDREEIMTFIVLSGFVLLVAAVAIALLEPNLSIPGLISTVVSSLFNVGPGLAEVGPAQTFGFFSGASKLLLGLLMIMGRLELYAILALFSPSLWRQFD